MLYTPTTHLLHIQKQKCLRNNLTFSFGLPMCKQKKSLLYYILKIKYRELDKHD